MSSHGTHHTHGHNPEYPAATTNDQVVQPHAVDPTAPSHQSHQHHAGYTDPNTIGNTQTFQSSDSTTDPNAKSSSKVVGDLKGMAHGVQGSLQAATGTMLRNKNMQEKGFEKMSEEDQRLAAKSGKPPVGTSTVSGDSAEAASYGTGRTTTELSHK